MDPLDHMRYMVPSLERLRDRGFGPRTILDIGAAHGHFRAASRSVWPDAKLTCVEANEATFRQYRDCLPEESLCCCLASRDGAADFWTTNLDPTSGGCSLYREAMPGFSDDHAVRTRIETIRIDTLFRGRRFDLIKLDTQGSELDCLRGGIEVLDRCQVVVIELSMVQYNRGGARIEDVIRWMADHDFVLADLCGPQSGYHRYRGRPTQVDGIFCQQHLTGLYGPDED